MGTLTDGFCARFTGRQAEMVAFLLHWEADYPLCGKTKEQVEAALVEWGIATGWDACLGVEDLSLEESQVRYDQAKADGIREFWKAFGEESPDEHRSHFPTERALALAQQMEKERDTAIARAEKAEAEVERLKALVRKFLKAMTIPIVCP